MSGHDLHVLPLAGHVGGINLAEMICEAWRSSHQTAPRWGPSFPKSSAQMLDNL